MERLRNARMLHEADEARIRKTYESSGIELNPDGVVQELVAEATEKIIEDRNGDIISRLLSQNERGMLARLHTKLGEFLTRQKAKREGSLERYNAIQDAYRQLTDAFQKKGKWSPDDSGTDPTVDLDTKARNRGDDAHGAQGEQMQFAPIDVGEVGKSVYESNFLPSTSKEEKQKRLIDLWQNVWNQKPIELNIVEDGKPRVITASFDPDYDVTNVKKTDLGKVMSSRNGSGGDRTVTLKLADDLYDLARTAEYYMSEEERGKQTQTHEGVKLWHYFFNDILYRDEAGNEIPYTVWVDVKEKDDGGYVYQLYARKTKEKTQQSQSGEIGPGDLSATTLSDTSISDANADDNPYAMPERRSVHGLSV